MNTHPTTTGPDSPAAATPPGAPLDLALIGHTNTGKTSVLRSLLRDRNVGEVADEAGTTRTSTRYEMTVAGRVAAYLWDTPGLEDAGPLLRRVRDAEREIGRSPAEALGHVLAQGDVPERERSPLETLRRCRAGLLVFDVRERPLEKYWEEHELLRLCGAPLVAVLNCAARPGARTDEWDRALRHHGLHAIVRYDAWASAEDDAQRLLEALHTLLGEPAATELARIARDRRAEERSRIDRSARRLAETLVDLAAYRRLVREEHVPAAQDDFRRLLGESWGRFLKGLAAAWGLSEGQLRGVQAEAERLSAEEGEDAAAAAAEASLWGTLGGVAGGAAGFAAKGLLVDVGLGGASLGLGAVGGAVLGGAIGGHRAIRAGLRRARGERELRFSEAAVDVALRRGIWLIRRVRAYGAASEEPIPAPTSAEELAQAEGPVAAAQRRALRTRQKAPASWSRLGTGEAAGRSEAGEREVDRLSGLLVEAVVGGA